MSLRHWSSLSFAVAVSSVSSLVLATPTFPATIRSHLALDYQPPCTLCHASVSGGGPVVTPVGSSLLQRGLASNNAALQAAERAKDIVAAGAAAKLEVPQSRLVFADEHVFDASDPEKRLSFVQAVVAAEAEFGTIGTVGSYRPPKMPAKYKGGGVGPSPAYSYTAAVV